MIAQQSMAGFVAAKTAVEAAQAEMTQILPPALLTLV